MPFPQCIFVTLCSCTLSCGRVTAGDCDKEYRIPVMTLSSTAAFNPLSLFTRLSQPGGAVQTLGACGCGGLGGGARACCHHRPMQRARAAAISLVGNSLPRARCGICRRRCCSISRRVVARGNHGPQGAGERGCGAEHELSSVSMCVIRVRWRGPRACKTSQT